MKIGYIIIIVLLVIYTNLILIRSSMALEEEVIKEELSMHILPDAIPTMQLLDNEANLYILIGMLFISLFATRFISIKKNNVYFLEESIAKYKLLISFIIICAILIISIYSIIEHKPTLYILEVLLNIDKREFVINDDIIVYINNLNLSIGLTVTILSFMVGRLIVLTILPALSSLRRITLSLFFGLCASGVITLYLAYINALYTTNILILQFVIIILLYLRLYLNIKLSIRSFINDIILDVKFSLNSIKTMSYFDKTLTAIIIIIWFVTYYWAIAYPTLETDALIYHFPLAKIMYEHNGLPLIKGGGVGIGLSGTYPMLFSAMGSYYYILLDNVVDAYLRMISVTMGLISVIITYYIGKEIFNSKVGLFSAFIFSMVPAFISYAINSTQITTVTACVVVSIWMLLNGIKYKDRKYFMISGLVYSFALLTSYMALYYIIPILFYITFLVIRQNYPKKILLWFILPLLIGIGPFVRNGILLQDPLYPELGTSPYYAELLWLYTKQSLNGVANFLITGKPNSDIIDMFINLLTYPSNYPLNFSLLSIALIFFSIVRLSINIKMLLISMILMPYLIILSSSTPFIRYLWILFPYAAIIIGILFYFIFNNNKKLQTLLLIFILFPLPVIISGHGYTFIKYTWSSNNDPLRYTLHPFSYKESIYKAYGVDAITWNWINANINNSKILTSELKIYYLKNNFDKIIPIDGESMEDLYFMYDVDDIINYLKENDISYIFIPEMEANSILQRILPLNKILGSHYFPIVYKQGKSTVYHVGPLNNELELGYIMHNGTRINSNDLITIHENSIKYRLITYSLEPLTITITYLDDSEGELRINMYDDYANKWIYDYHVIKKSGSGLIKKESFIVPAHWNKAYLELGLYAAYSDFNILKIETTLLYGKTIPVNRLSDADLSAQLLYIYLPFMRGTESLEINVDSKGKLSEIIIADGVIKPGDNKWWEKHDMISRTDITYNPYLEWNASYGLYTIIIEGYEQFEEPIYISINIKE